MIWAVRYKSDVESHLEREKEDGNLLAKCVEELKKKGIEFDLLKEVDALRRAKSLRVEAKIVKKMIINGSEFDYSCNAYRLVAQMKLEQQTVPIDFAAFAIGVTKVVYIAANSGMISLVGVIVTNYDDLPLTIDLSSLVMIL
ncbi:hypothetical protein Q3G72_005283 [Acer saccharum]|nr:hypothetical protein Q3G72_005283 [Acer saccharum]